MNSSSAELCDAASEGTKFARSGMRCPSEACTGIIIQEPVLHTETRDYLTDSFYLCFYDIYKCSRGHYPCVCKKCGSCIITGAHGMHVYTCWGGYMHQYDEYDQCVNHVSDNRLLILLGYSGLDDIICVPIKIPDYSFSIIANKYDNLGVGPKVARLRKKESECFDEILDFILDQHAYCPLCDMYFDSYPSKEVIMSHFSKCEYRKYSV